MKCRLQREVDRCVEAVLRLALLRPGVAFTVLDRQRGSVVLRLLGVGDVAGWWGRELGGTRLE